MANASDKTKRDDRKRNAISADMGREIEHFAKRNRVSIEEVRNLIRQFGDDLATDPGADKDPEA